MTLTRNSPQIAITKSNQAAPSPEPNPMKATSMYQHYMAVSAPPYIRHKCRATDFVPRLLHSAAVGSAASEGGQFHSDRTSFRIDVRLGSHDAKSAYSAQCSDPVVDCMCQRFLQIISPRTGEFF